MIDSKHIKEIVHINGKEIDVIPTNQLDLEETYYQKQPIEIPPPPSGETTNKPLGELFEPDLAIKVVVRISVYGQKVRMHSLF